MKQTIIRLILFIYFIGSLSVTCLASTSYTIQIAASKTPTDYHWLAKKHQIELAIHEFQEEGWYKYIVGQFDTKQQANQYIAQHLLSKSLPGAIPRLLPDSLKMIVSKIELELPDTVSADKELAISDTLQHKDSFTNQSADAVPSNKTTRKKWNSYDKYKSWIGIVSIEELQRAEMSIIEVAHSIIPRSWIPAYEKMVDKAIRYPVILFFILLILLIILNAIVIMVILEISNSLKNKLERFDQVYTTMYERALTGYLFQEYDLETAISRIKDIHRSRNRKVLLDVLFNFKKNLSGELNKKLLEVYFRLGLENYSYRKVKSYSFYKQILGIRELTNLYPAGAFPIVALHINDTNDELRAEAQTSYVRLNHEEPFRFLKHLRKPFTRWTQLTSFYIFKLHRLPAPSFVEYLQSDMYNVRNFSLRMIIYFQQKENAEAIIKLLYTEREMTRFLAIRAVNELGIHEAKHILKEIYSRETFKNRREIIKGFLHIGDANDFPFLERIIRDKDITLKIEACRSLYFMNDAGRDKLLSLQQEKELHMEAFIAHIYDPRN